MFYSQQHLIDLLNKSQEIMFIVDERLRIHYVNDCFCQTLDYGVDMVMNSSILDFFSEKIAFNKVLDKEARSTDYLDLTTQGLTQSGKKVEMQLTLSPMLDDAGKITGILGKGSNLITAELFEEKLYDATYIDSITGYGNRELVVHTLNTFFDESENSGKRLLCLGIDFENLQTIDSLYGYSVGNEALKIASEMLHESDPENNVVARIHSSKIIVLHSFTDEATARAWTSSVIANFDKPIKVKNGRTLELQINAGAVLFPCGAKDALTAMKYVQLAHSVAVSSANENCVFYEPEMSKMFMYKLEIETELRQALENDEFEVHYQPKIHLPERSIYGFEALIRWNNPERGLLSPFHFLEIAEDSKMIIDIGEWIMTKACEQQALWKKRGLEYKISINVSITQMKMDNFVEMMADILDKTGATPHCIELELTESVFMENFELMNALIKRLKKLGVSISLDDFGTGYSSLSYLGEVPIDSLKIDKSFIHKMLTNEKAAKITESILQLSQQLDIETIAEGTEDAAQVDFLEKIKCRFVQGYYFYRPMPISEIEKIIN